MTTPEFAPRAGGIKLVFDVRDADVAAAEEHFTAAGCAVSRYYPDDRPRRGGAASGWVRLGAERPLHSVDPAESTGITAELDAARATSPVPLDPQGVDTWTSGNGADGGAGDREPRRPLPRAGVGAAAATRPAASG